MGGDKDDESRQTISAAQLLSMGSCSAEEIGRQAQRAVLTAEELREERHAQPLLRELDVPAWQEVAVMRPRWRAMLKSTKIPRI